MNRNRWLLVAVAAVSVWASYDAYAGEFRAFIKDNVEYSPYTGDWSRWDHFSLSDNGQAIVGWARTDAPGIYQSYRWTPAGGVEWLPFPSPPHYKSWGCEATALNRTGSKVYINCAVNEDGWPWEAYVLDAGSFTKFPQMYEATWVYDATPSLNPAPSRACGPLRSQGSARCVAFSAFGKQGRIPNFSPSRGTR